MKNTNNLIEKTKKLKILYVEDNKTVRLFMSLIFKEFFDNIDIAVNGAKGLELYKRDYVDYDIVISDVSMPIMDGVEMSKAILDINPLQNILISSSHDDSKDLEKLMDIGINNFIHKPFDMQELINELQKIISTIERKHQKQRELNDIKSLNHELDTFWIIT